MEKIRKAIFVPLELWQQIKNVATNNNRSIIGQLREWLKNEKSN